MKKLFSTKMNKGQKVDGYVLMKKAYIDRLSELDVAIRKEMQVDLILGLSLQYEPFIIKYI